MFRWCASMATVGWIPPRGSWRRSCFTTTLERMRRDEVTTAAQVSSAELSRARTVNGRPDPATRTRPKPMFCCIATPPRVSTAMNAARRLVVASRTLTTRPSLPPANTDRETLARSAEMLDALVGSTAGLGLGDANDANEPVDTRSSSSNAPSSSPDVVLARMFVPPANDPLLDYLASALQKHGRRSSATRLVSRTLLHVHTSTRAPPLPIVREAILAVSPAIKSGSHRYGTKTLQIPYALTEKQRVHAGVRALLVASASRPGKTVDIRLARELIGVLQGDSKALVEKERLHKLGMVNRGNLGLKR